MSSVYGGGIPSFFTSPMAAFPMRNLFHSTDRPSENGLGGTAFTQEDRLMMQLLYQQQQAIQIQLQSMALSMQQLQMALVGIPKPPVPMGVYGGIVNNASTSTNTAACAPVTEQPSFSHQADTRMSMQHDFLKDQRGHSVATGGRQSSPVVQSKGISLSCTPPLEDLDASRQSATNRSTDSAPPWDPSAGSRHSSVAQVIRTENPLLSSLRGKLPTPNRSVTTSATGGTGYSASANVSTYLDDSKPTLRPTVHPSASSSAHLDPDMKNTTSSLFRYRASGSHQQQEKQQQEQRQQQQQQQQQQQRRIVLDNRKVDTFRPLHSSSNCTTAVQTTTSPAVAKGGGELQHLKEWGSVGRHINEGSKEDCGETLGSAIGYDSQSDGYGSYETREYLKSVGII